ncbi:MAG: hypothetical protein AAGE84_00275 [Cyanobacteria bacterium P01_G01_bin.39]
MNRTTSRQTTKPSLARAAVKCISLIDRFRQDGGRQNTGINISILITLLLGFSASAATQTPSGWTVKTKPNGSVVYTSPQSQAIIIIRPAPSDISSMNARDLLTKLVPVMANNPMCAGLAQGQLDQDGIVFTTKVQNELALCSVSTVEGRNGPFLAMATEPPGANIGTVNIARKLLANRAAVATNLIAPR